MDLAKLYRSFWRWYNDNISRVDFNTIEYDVHNKSNDEILKKFKERERVIQNLLIIQNYFTKDKADMLKAMSSNSFEELAIKLAIRGY